MAIQYWEKLPVLLITIRRLIFSETAYDDWSLRSESSVNAYVGFQLALSKQEKASCVTVITMKIQCALAGKIVMCIWTSICVKLIELVRRREPTTYTCILCTEIGNALNVGNNNVFFTSTNTAKAIWLTQNSEGSKLKLYQRTITIWLWGVFVVETLDNVLAFS